MKIAILGAGAMGCLYGGLLSEAGNEVWLLDIWEEHIKRIKENGLCIVSKTGNRILKNINATLNPSEIEEAELVLVFVKSMDIEKAISQNKEIFGKNTTVLTLQNGLGNIEKISQYIDPSFVVGGITAHGATMLEAGKIRHAGEGETYIGELDGAYSKRISQIAKLFNDAKIYTKITENINGFIWGKLLVNVGINALTAITKLKNGQILEHPELEELMDMAVNEAYQVAKAKGIKIPYTDPIMHTKKICNVTAQNNSSMLQDILKHKKTEINMLNGAIVKEGEKLGIQVPINKMLTNLVLAIQK